MLARSIRPADHAEKRLRPRGLTRYRLRTSWTTANIRRYVAGKTDSDSKVRNGKNVEGLCMLGLGKIGIRRRRAEIEFDTRSYASSVSGTTLVRVDNFNFPKKNVFASMKKSCSLHLHILP